ncbi:unnamed protein product [Calicophoron daubneyi]|uniref:Transmembrane protein 26 n=1 Tax=Calicophoron daubneyi TaxID=300641 RepID=A0AAV2T6D4_CALDB
MDDVQEARTEHEITSLACQPTFDLECPPPYLNVQHISDGWRKNATTPNSTDAPQYHAATPLSSQASTSTEPDADQKEQQSLKKSAYSSLYSTSNQAVQSNATSQLPVLGRPAPDILITNGHRSSVGTHSNGCASRFARRCGNLVIRAWLAFVSLVIAIRAILVRMVYVCFTCITIVIVVTEKRDANYWFLCILIVPLLIDLVLAIKAHLDPNTTPWAVSKWFSLCAFAYLICACPPIWIIELHHMDQVNNATAMEKLQALNRTVTVTTPSWLPSIRLPENESVMIMGDDIEKYILETELGPGNYAEEELTRVRRDINGLSLQALQLKNFSLKEKIRILEQLLLLSVIIGRWLMPREGMTWDQLSQLLLINIGNAADILDIFEAFNEDVVRQNDYLRAIILCLWQASLLQFCFNKTAVRETPTERLNSRSFSSSRSVLALSTQQQQRPQRSPNPSEHRDAILFTLSQQTPEMNSSSCCCRCSRSQQTSGDILQEEAKDLDLCPCGRLICFLYRDRPCLCCETELWAIGMSLILQDIPFLTMRLTLILAYNVRSYSNLFFTCKNSLLILLQLFRSVVIVAEAYTHSKQQVRMDIESQRSFR